ncbi:hypothetical protein [Microvirga thermotolerans]|uniref:Uncharacterized protein n=1 Tax=Microvirga thermotolerans TaxID=2651334 RepID=A0A5P9JYJ7_9HYPH|nr:hypothetical protein [Microvirga thermotolerans]QFU16325.1 hypothetical protein GDR74_08855 [Microvirga thermotolerans]
MTFNRRAIDGFGQRPVMYSPEILPRLQSLLARLADIDFAFERDLESVSRGEVDERLKRKERAILRTRHRDRRAPYLRDIAALQARIYDASGREG